MTPKPDQLDLTRDQLDLLISDIAGRSPAILPVLRRVRDGAIGYAEITGARSARVLRLGPPGSLPILALISDVRGEGPEGFRLAFLKHLFPRATAVLLVADERDALPYESAAAHCADLRRHVVLVECPQTAIGDWTEFAYSCGIQRNSLVAFINDPNMPSGFDVIDVDDISPATPPSGPVH